MAGGYYDSEQEAAADELELCEHPNPMPTKEGRNAAETRTASSGAKSYWRWFMLVYGELSIIYIYISVCCCFVLYLKLCDGDSLQIMTVEGFFESLVEGLGLLLLRTVQQWTFNLTNMKYQSALMWK